MLEAATRLVHFTSASCRQVDGVKALTGHCMNRIHITWQRPITVNA